MVLVDTPLGPYFGECLSLDDLDEMNIEIIRNTLNKAYLEDFYAFSQKVGGSTAEVMHDILTLEAGTPPASPHLLSHLLSRLLSSLLLCLTLSLLSSSSLPCFHLSQTAARSTSPSTRSTPSST